MMIDIVGKTVCKHIFSSKVAIAITHDYDAQATRPLVSLKLDVPVESVRQYADERAKRQQISSCLSTTQPISDLGQQ